nr:DUF4238 domain-containing protein [uncultured Acidocella sp.]
MMPPQESPQRKPHQHHVWQYYLRAWSVDGKVSFLQNHKIDATGTNVLGVKKNFYKIKSITDEDVKLLHFLIALDNVHPVARKHHEMVLQRILTPTLFVQKHREKLNNLDLIDDYLDAYNTNVVDDYHTNIESSFIPLLDRARNEDFSWYDNDQECISFFNYLAAQQMRTRGVKERTITRLKERMDLDVSRIWDIMALIFGFNIGCSLFLERKRRRLIVLHNKTAVSFITSDQPVVNLHANGETPPESASLYYPISPRIALYLPEPDKKSDIPLGTLTPDTANFLNLRIAQASHSQVYAQSAESLLAFKDLIV